MDKLPSKNTERLLLRIQNARDSRLPLSSFSDADHDRLKILQERGFVQGCDSYSPHNDPDSPVYVIGPLFRSVTLTTSGADYLSELSEERKARWLRFGRDILMMIIGAVVTLAVTFAFNKLTGTSDSESSVSVSNGSPALITTPSDVDAHASE